LLFDLIFANTVVPTSYTTTIHLSLCTRLFCEWPVLGGSCLGLGKLLSNPT